MAILFALALLAVLIWFAPHCTGEKPITVGNIKFGGC